jgi:hypothetical protein
VAPGAYRLALAVWIDASGRIVDGRLLSKNLDPLSSPRILDQIKNVVVGQPPPAGLEQPVTVIILPRPPNQTGDCRPASE